MSNIGYIYSQAGHFRFDRFTNKLIDSSVYFINVTSKMKGRSINLMDKIFDRNYSYISILNFLIEVSHFTQNSFLKII